MRGMIIVLASSNEVDANRILDKLLIGKENAVRAKLVTTKEKDQDNIKSEEFLFVSTTTFFDILECSGFLEYEMRDGDYYGTPHIHANQIGDSDLFCVRSVEISLEIKKRYPDAVTIYILNKQEAEKFKIATKQRDVYANAKKLDFLVIYENIDDTICKIESIIDFMRENGMRTNW